APIGMPLAKRFRIDPMLMALAVATGLSAGAFAPTSLFGIVTYGTAEQAGIDLDPLIPFAVAIAANLLLFAGAFVAFGGLGLARGRSTDVAVARPRAAFTRLQMLTLACMLVLIVLSVVASALGLNPDIGILCFAFGAVLMLVDPAAGRSAIPRVPWSTVLRG